jgi:hypothetical protein
MSIIKNVFYVLTSSVLLVSCGDDKDTTGDGKVVEVKSELEDRTENIENIFFNIPSPVETVNILKQAGATYEWNLPLDPKKLDGFSGVVNQALAMGIYGADLNYASVFNQSNDMYMFLSCAEKLGNDLGVGGVFTKEVTGRIEENVENKDSMQTIISETFWQIDNQLMDEGRENVSALIVAGGWLEGIYLATQLSVLNPKNEEIKQRIAEQKYSIENLLNLLKSYENSKGLEEIIISYEELKTIFDQIKEVKVTGSTADEEGMPVVGQKIQLEMSDDLLKELTQKIAEIRADITN